MRESGLLELLGLFLAVYLVSRRCIKATPIISLSFEPSYKRNALAWQVLLLSSPSLGVFQSLAHAFLRCLACHSFARQGLRNKQGCTYAFQGQIFCHDV